MGTILKVRVHSKSSAKCRPWGLACGSTFSLRLRPPFWASFVPVHRGSPAVNPGDSAVVGMEGFMEDSQVEDGKRACALDRAV